MYRRNERYSACVLLFPYNETMFAHQAGERDLLLNLRQMIDPTLIGLGILVANIISGAFWLLIAAIVNVYDFGHINYQVALASILAAGSLLGLNNTIITFLSKGNELLLKQSSFLVLLLTSTIAIVLALFNQVGVAILLLGINAFSITLAEATGRKHYKRYALVMIANRALQLVLSIALYYVIGPQGIIIGYAGSSLILGYRLFFLVKETAASTTSLLSMSEVRPKMRFTMHAFSLSLSQVLSMYFDKLVIAPIAGFAILGLYQFGYQFLMFLSVIPASLYQYLLSQEASGIDRPTVKKLGLTISIVLAIFSYFFIPYFIRWFFPQYSDAITSAQIMVFGIIPITLNSIMNSSLLGREDTRPVLIGSATYVASLVSLLLLLKDNFGLVGLALSPVISQSLQSLAIWLASRKQ
jgi:O-antigen/teichoic acid export membrane protein